MKKNMFRRILLSAAMAGLMSAGFWQMCAAAQDSVEIENAKKQGGEMLSEEADDESQDVQMLPESVDGESQTMQIESDSSGKIKIGLTLYSIQNEYTKRFAEAAQSQAEEMGIDLLLYDGNYDASRQNAQVEAMIREEVDGILMIPQDSADCAEGVEIAAEAGIPVVSVNTRVDSNQIISYVGSDDIVAGELVAQSVADILDGIGNVVILEGPIGQSAQIERLEGMKHVLAEYPDLHVIGKKTANWSRLEAKNVMSKWLQTFDRIDAVIAENDDMALGALEAIEEAGQNMFAYSEQSGNQDAEEIADQNEKQNTMQGIYVVGIDGSEEGLQAVEERRMYMTVFQDAEAQSQKALEVLNAYIQGENVEETYWIPLETIKAE